MKLKLKVPYRYQRTDFTCGPAAARMILGYWGQRVSEKRLRSVLGTVSSTGTRRASLARGLRRFGLRVRAASGSSIADVRRALAAGLPAVVNYREPEEGVSHYAVVTGFEGSKMILNDPYIGPGFRIGVRDFTGRWYGKHRGKNARWLLVAAGPGRRLPSSPRK